MDIRVEGVGEMMGKENFNDAKEEVEGTKKRTKYLNDAIKLMKIEQMKMKKIYISVMIQTYNNNNKLK